MNKLTKIGSILMMGLALATAPLSTTYAEGDDVVTMVPTLEPTNISLNGNNEINSVNVIVTSEAFDVIETNDAEITMSSQTAEVVSAQIEDRSQGIYVLTKKGYTLPSQHIDIQWLIHDLCIEYDLPERWVFGMILAESTFDTLDRSSANCQGLLQISPYWLKSKTVPELIPGRRDRDLYDPYDNLITGIEMMCWARDNYGIDMHTEQGFMDYAYWHNTGKFKRNVSWAYSRDCIRFGNELTAIQ